MLFVHPTEDFFAASRLFLRQAFFGQIGEQDRSQYKIVRLFKMLLQQVVIRGGKRHPVLGVFPKRQHTGQDGAGLAPKPGKQPRFFPDEVPARQQTVFVRCMAVGAEDIGARGLNGAFLPPKRFLNLVPIGNIFRAEFIQFRFH